MKKLGFILMLACIAVFSSCKDDKNDDVEPAVKDYAKEIAGRYAGKDGLSVTLAEQPAIVSDGVITLTTSSVNKINLELKDFSFAGAVKVGDIILKDIVVEGNDKEVIIKKTEIKGYKLSNDLEGQTVDITVESGKVIGDKIDLHLTIAEKEFGNIKVLFKGQKANGSGETKLTEFVAKHDAIEGDAIFNEADKKITLLVKDGANLADLKNVVVEFKISDKATAKPVSGDKIDLTSGSASITVTAEDGVMQSEYTIICVSTAKLVYDMEKWFVEKKGLTGKPLFSAPEGWTSSNHGVYMLKELLGLTDKYSITQSAEAHTGNSAAKIETLDTKGNGMIPKVTTGSLFTGTFKTDMGQPLKSTKFGIPFSKQPLRMKGFYKYTAGPLFLRSTAEKPDQVTEEPETKDMFSINAVLYEIESDTDEYLTGLDVNTSNRRVAEAKFSNGASEGNKYHEFNVAFEFVNGKTYDAKKKYRIALIASSSKDGDTYSGAPGSILFLDDLELIVAE